MDAYAFPVITVNAFRAQAPTERARIEMLNEYEKEGRQKLYDYASRRKILPFVADLCIRIERDVLFWGEISEQYRLRNQNVIAQLDRVFSILRTLDVKKIFLSENFGALLSSKRDVSLFASGDVDIYADIAGKDRIYRAFELLNYEKKERYAGGKLITTVFYNNDVLNEGFGIDINWDPLSRLKLPCMAQADEFVDWEALRYYRDSNIILPPAEALMYICLLHISLHSFSRKPDIRLYTDIVNCAESCIDWNKILGYAGHDKTLIRVLTAAYLANRLLDVELPSTVTELIKANSRKIHKVLRIVYCEEKNRLIYEPTGIKVFRVEVNCSDHGSGMLKMLFPGKQWLKEVYLPSSGNYLFAEIKHLRHLL